MKKSIFLIVGLLILLFNNNSIGQELKSQTKNIIFLIGDGMGLSQITAGMYANNNKLHLEEFKYIGIHKPYSADNLITDSAAAGTAFSTGHKTYNGAIGVDRDSIPRKTLLEIVEENNYASGLIATSTITHATPAAYYAHQPSRNMYEEIALDLTKNEIDFLVGGGLKHFAQRADKVDLTKKMELNGYIVSDYTKEQLSYISIKNDQNFIYFTAADSPPKYLEGRAYLETATTKAINYLDNKTAKGFFLMIEGSQIDWGGHDNDQDYIISEMLEFDRVVKIAYDFAKKDGNTLVVVTSDHETGGMSVNYGSEMNDLVTKYTSGGHTGDLMPVFAYGPGAENFIGIYENTDLFFKMLEAFGFEN